MNIRKHRRMVWTKMSRRWRFFDISTWPAGTVDMSVIVNNLTAVSDGILGAPKVREHLSLEEMDEEVRGIV